MERKDMERVSAFELGEENTAYAPYFIGRSYLCPLNSQEVSIANVTFEPGCRNNWHIHHGAGQILICVGGRGWYQEAGQAARALRNGDVVYIAPEVKHWHGAASEQPFAHLSLSVPAEGAYNEWLESVDDAQYGRLSLDD